ncbi:MAG: hypothetical protein ACOC38_06740 [Promethearchaeia archaeon]
MKLKKYTPHDFVQKQYSEHQTQIADSVRLWSKAGRRKGAVLLPLLFMLFALPLISTTGFWKLSSLSEGSTVTVSAEPPELNLTYYSLWNESKTPVKLSGDTLVGDHIILNATWTPDTTIGKTALDVRAPAIPANITNVSTSSSIEINTRKLGNNATCTINATAWWGDGYVTYKLFHEVFIGNFFVPHLELQQPNGGEVWTGVNNVTWTAADNNTEENLTFEVLLSADAGASYQLLRADLNRTWFEWNCTGFLNLTTYKIQVRATDGIYIVSDESDNTFTAGDIYASPTTTTTTTGTTTTTTRPTTLSPQIGVIISVTIVASAFLAVGVYYVAKTRL